MALLSEVIESRSSVVNRISPRARMASRRSRISARILAWYSGCLASSKSIQETVFAVVSCPARVRVCICAFISTSLRRLLGSSEAFALAASPQVSLVRNSGCAPRCANERTQDAQNVLESFLCLLLDLRALFPKQVTCDLAEQTTSASNTLQLSCRGLFEDVDDPVWEIVPHDAVEQLQLRRRRCGVDANDRMNVSMPPGTRDNVSSNSATRTTGCCMTSTTRSPFRQGHRSYNRMQLGNVSRIVGTARGRELTCADDVESGPGQPLVHINRLVRNGDNLLCPLVTELNGVRPSNDSYYIHIHTLRPISWKRGKKPRN